MEGSFGSLLKTVACLLGFLVIICPAVFIIFRLIFAAYFISKNKEGGITDGEKQKIDEG